MNLSLGISLAIQLEASASSEPEPAFLLLGDDPLVLASTLLTLGDDILELN
ncbi:hypothetical protein MWN34_05355 [Ancylobacter sp. 6x-1]|uniref:Uncharacterized protein n=1 Tax=Ancylobacter crimeensis TaxID=2579147 RepID=A0ABT0D960_9HYPH|nr:hypothetical protein [Ancylobacter crimeensis]MCK0196337.1 hypothetical protein [Ancylobacter crimeensis]